MNDEYVNETWTYAGKRWTSENKVVDEFLDAAGEARWYAPFMPAWARPASLYTVSRQGTSAIVTKGPKGPVYIGPAEVDVEKRAEWEVQDREAKARAEAIKKGKLAADISAIDELATPLRKLYWKQKNAVARSVLLARIIEGITK